MTDQITEPVRTLLTGLIDYAGLFPPAKLSMSKATATYARHLQGPHAFALGRFLVPVSRLEEFGREGAMVMPGTYATSGYQEMMDAADPWSVSLIVDRPLEETLDLIDGFNAHHSDAANGRAKIDAIEMKVGTPGEIDDVIDEIPDDVRIAFEIPPAVVMGGDPRGFAAALSGGEASAKVRCGGVTADAFPSPEDLARVIHACALADAPLKFTAGLHHPVRAEHALTYEDNAPRGVMHGFLNVFLAAGFARSKMHDEVATIALLSETDADAFRVTQSGIAWRDTVLETAKIARTRESFALGYGSCSFDEPLDDLRTLGWI